MPEDDGRIVVFGCKHTATQVLEVAEAEGTWGLPEYTYVELPCLGALDGLEVLRAIDRGAPGVVAVGCYAGRCRHVSGSQRAEQVMSHVGKVLEDAGWDPGRLGLVLGSPLEGDVILKLKESLESIGGMAP